MGLHFRNSVVRKRRYKLSQFWKQRYKLQVKLQTYRMISLTITVSVKLSMGYTRYIAAKRSHLCCCWAMREKN